MKKSLTVVLGLVAAILAAVSIALALDSGSSEPATAQTEPTPVPRWPEPPPAGLQYVGAYRIIAADYQGSLTHHDIDTADFATREVAADIEGARASSLFPQKIPDGYRVVEASSSGRPSELYLDLTLSGPTGDLLVTRSRPNMTPIDVRPDDEYQGEWQMLHSAGGAGFYVAPPAGMETTEPAIIRGFENGVDMTISGIGLDREQAEEVFHELAVSFPGKLADRLNPVLPPQDELLPLPQDVEVSGTCEVTPHMSLEYAAQETRLSLMSTARCVSLRDAQVCSAAERQWLGDEADSIDLACDVGDEPIKAEWEASGGISECSYGQYAILDGNDLVSGFVDCSIVITWVPEQVPIEVCLTIRGHESCARFNYTLQ